MQPGKSPRRRAWPASIAAAAALCALAPAFAAVLLAAPAALAAKTRPSDGVLSPRLAELAKPAVRSAPPAEQAQTLSLAAEGPGSLIREGNRVLLEVRFDHGAAASVEALRQAGAAVVNVSRRYQTVTVAAKPDELRALNTVPRVAGVTEVVSPLTYAATCPSGPVVSEGDEQLGAREAREAFGVDGTGVEVGVLSDSFATAEGATTTASQDAASGDLPGNECGSAPAVHVLSDYTPKDPEEEPAPSDEGRAMAQIVHDLAPGAEISFSTAFTGLTAFAEKIEALAADGAKVIVDDVGYFNEPFFQEGPVGVAVSKVTAEGVNYFSSAGNNNLIDGEHDIASWEAPEYRDSGGCPGGVVARSTEYEESEEALEEEEPGLELPGIGLNASHCLDFDPSESTSDDTFGITVQNGANLTVDLQWSEPWYGVNTDLDAFLLDAAGHVIAESPYANEVTPYEEFSWKNETGSSEVVSLVVNRYAGGTPRVKFALLQNGGGVASTEYEESSPGPNGDIVGPTIYGHNGSENAISVGAVPYFSDMEPEQFSSRGPVTHYFGPVASSTTPAAPLEPPETLDKPDVVATDGGINSFFGSCSNHRWRFYGTSASAPHAAAVAALARNAVKSATQSEVKDALLGTAAPLPGFPETAVGTGLIRAPAAIAALESEPFSEGPGAILEPASENCDLAPSNLPSSEEEIEGTSPAASAPAPLPATATTQSSGAAEDGSPPTSFFRKHPPKVILTRRRGVRLAFRFGSDQGAVTFLCKVDRRRLHRCRNRFVRWYRLGRHVLRVKARRNGDGATDATPAVFRFRVRHVPHRVFRRRHTRHHHRS